MEEGKTNLFEKTCCLMFLEEALVLEKVCNFLEEGGIYGKKLEEIWTKMIV